MKDKKLIVSIIIICVVVLVVGFVSGVAYEKSKLAKSPTSSFANRFGGQGNFNVNGRTGSIQNMRGGFQGGAISGEVISLDAKTMTIKLRDGGSKIVLISPSTKVEKTVDGAISDVSVGKQVMITGDNNTDGSVSATSVQIRPDIPLQKSQTTN